MLIPGDMNIQGLALLGGLQGEGDESPAFGTRMFDTDGDGQNDLFLVDSDGDGAVDGVVRGIDTDNDGLLDTFVQYNEDGEIEALGRIDPETREFEVIDTDAEDFEDTLSSLGLGDSAAPEDALFTSFDDPYLIESFGTFGEEVPETSEPLAEASGVGLNEVDETDLGSLDSAAAADGQDAASAQADGSSGTDAPDEPVAEVTPRVVEIEDYAGDGSDLHAKIDQDGDGLADDDQKLFQTSDGTWHGDINRDGSSEEVAFDRDQDGRIESVDTTGQGSTTDTVDAERVAAPESDNIVDRHPGEDDFRVEEAQAASEAGWTSDAGGDAPDPSADGWQVTDADADAGVLADDSAGAASASGDADFSASDSDSGSTADAGSTYDSGSSYDSGSVDSSDSADVGSTTIDSDPTDSGGTGTE
jgi:hypothetical protein